MPTREHRRIRRRGSRPAARTSAATALEAAAKPAVEQARERAAGGPEDIARYQCACGFVFDAPVSASVGCPHCGCAQAW